MAAEEPLRAFVKRLLFSNTPKKAKHERACSCSDAAPSSCPEHPSRGAGFKGLGGPEYSRLSADALKELETDVEKGIGRGIRTTPPPDIPRIPAKSPPVGIPRARPTSSSFDMDSSRTVSPGLSTGIIPLTSPATKSCRSRHSSLPFKSLPFSESPKPHYYHFRRKHFFTNGGFAVASGGLVERFSPPQVVKDKETLERLAANEQAGSSGRHLKLVDGAEAGLDYISVTTFNILAPIYKRLSKEGDRESKDEARWKKRNQQIVDLLLKKGSCVICLQEFWHKNEELSHLYQSRLGAAGYTMFQMGRTNDKGDGLFTAIKSDHLRVLDVREIVFHDCGDRVAQLFHLQATELLQKCSIDDHEARPFDWCGTDHAAELILVNTHLMFPHNGNACVIRLRQVYKLVDYLGRYQRERNLPPMPIILCGDWNGSKHGQVYKFLRSRGCISAYDAVHDYEDDDSSRWVSHQNHRGNLAGVDFIYLLNPSSQCEKLEADWKYGAFAMIRVRGVAYPLLVSPAENLRLRRVWRHDGDNGFSFFLIP